MAIEHRARFALSIAFAASIGVYRNLHPDIPPYLYFGGEYVAVGRPFVAFTLPVTAIAIWWLFASLSRQPSPAARRSRRVGAATALFLSAFHVTTLVAFVAEQLWLTRVLGVMVGAFLIATGNDLPRLRPNLVWGIRTPQTLRSRVVWKRVHRLGGYIRVAMGLLVCGAAVAGIRGFHQLIVGAVCVEVIVCVAAGFVYSRERRALLRVV